MAAVQTVWGIDIGRCAFKALKLRPASEGTVEIMAHDYVEHAKILSQPDADRHELIANALEKFLSRNDLSKDAVVVGVPGQHTLARFTKLPPVAPKRIPDIIRYEADQQIPFDMDEVIWDFQTFEQEGLPDLEVGIFAMKRELLREHLLHFEQAAIGPIAVQSGPLAVYNAAHFDGLLGSNTTILIDIGADNTDLVIATTHSLWTRTIPIGGNACTEALVKSFKLSFSKAENLKRTAETSKYRRQIFQAMRPIFADLVQELQRSIGFYSTTHRDAEFGKVVGMGNAFQLPGLQKYLQQNLGMTVDTPDSFQKVIPTAAASADTLAGNRLGFYAAYGLALQGLDLGKIASNLLPTEIAKQVVWRKKRPAFAAAAAGLVLAGGLIWFRQTADMNALATSSAGVEGVIVDSVDQADEIIQGGAESYRSPRARAIAIREAGRLLKSELGKRKNQGNKERAETERIVEVQHRKGFVPRILQVVHESIPTPAGALGRAQTSAEVLAAIESDGVPRGQRRQIIIKSLDMMYEPDLHDYAWESLVRVPPPINDPGAVLPGIFVKITCSTPNQAGPQFVSDAFMNALRANGRRPGQGFYFDMVNLFDGRKISDTAGGRGRHQSPTDAAAYRDVITDEPAGNDWEFEIWVAVILEDMPELEEDEDSEAEEDDG